MENTKVGVEEEYTDEQLQIMYEKHEEQLAYEWIVKHGHHGDL